MPPRGRYGATVRHCEGARERGKNHDWILCFQNVPRHFDHRKQNSRFVSVKSMFGFHFVRMLQAISITESKNLILRSQLDVLGIPFGRNAPSHFDRRKQKTRLNEVKSMIGFCFFGALRTISKFWYFSWSNLARCQRRLYPGCRCFCIFIDRLWLDAREGCPRADDFFNFSWFKLARCQRRGCPRAF